MRAGLQVALAAVGILALPTFIVFIVLVLAVGIPESVAGPAAMWGLLMGLFAAFLGMVVLAVIELLNPSKDPA